MLFYLPSLIKKTLLSLLFCPLFFCIISSPISARVLVKNGVKLPLVAESNIMGSEIRGRVLVNTEDPLFIENNEEPPSAFEIIQSRGLWQDEVDLEENEPPASGGFENLLENNSNSLNLGNLNLPRTGTFANLANSLDFDLIREKVDSLVVSSLDQFASSPVTFSETLQVLGATSLASTTVSGPLTQDGTLLISEGKNIDVVGDTLRLQSEGLGTIDFIAGKTKLDMEGNLTVSGQLSVAGGLITDIISPLVADAVMVGRNLKVEEGIETTVLSVLGKTTLSDLSVSGAVNFQSFAASSYGRVGDLILDRGLMISDKGEAPSVGTATIFAGTRQVIVPNTRVTRDSRIFLSIDTSTFNPQPTTYNLPPLFVSQKAPSSFFVVATDQPLQQDLTFNWLMIN